MVEEKNQLAIIIPCSRLDYLDAALFSLSVQTCKKFKIYLGDDAVSGDINSILKRYSNSLNIVYYRFPENLGKKDLIAQWERCIQLSNDEPWIWVFSDDDIADSGCVDAFYSIIDKVDDKFNVLRFNSLVIDSKGQVIRICQPNPQVEDAMVFAYHRFKRERYSFLSNYIFSRQIYVQKKGFTKFPIAWGSDDATWMEFSENKGIYTIEGPFIRWRMSNNISSVNIKNRRDKMLANVQFLHWLKSKFKDKRNEELNLDDRLLLNLSKDWIINQWINESSGKLIWDVKYWATLLNEVYRDGIHRNIKLLLKINTKIILRKFLFLN